MPKKRKVVPLTASVRETESPNGESVFVDEPSQDEIEDANKLGELQATFGGKEYVLRVERYNEENSEWEIVDKYKFDSFDPFVVSHKFGGGRYRGTLYNDKGRYVEGGRVHFNFAKAKETEKIIATSPLQDPAVLFVLENMKSHQTMMLEMFKASMTQEKTTPISEIMAGLKTMKDLEPSRENPMKGLKDLLELQALIANKLGRDTEDEKGGTGIVGEILEAFKGLNQGARVLPRPLPPAPGRPLPPATGFTPLKPGVSGLPVFENPVLENTPEVLNVIAPVKQLLTHAPSFAQAADLGGDPEKWADRLISILETETVPALVKHFHGFVNADGVWDRILEAASEPEKIEAIFKAAPVLQPHRDWVLSVIDAAVQTFDEPEPPGVTVNGSQDV